MRVTRYKPSSRVAFYTEQGELVARTTDNPNSREDDDIISIQTSRNIGNDSPTFSVTLTRRKQWHKWITSNDLVYIHMERPPEASSLVFVGLVDDVRKEVTIQGDSVQRNITITGRGLSKAFLQFDIGVTNDADISSVSVGWLAANGVFVSGKSPAYIIETILERIAKKFINYKWGNNKDLFGVMKYKLSDRPDTVLSDDSSLISWLGSFWAMLRTIAEDPFYEMYWEVEGASPTMIVRPTPFNKGNWEALDVVTITDEDVVVDSIGRSDIETYTLYSAEPKISLTGDESYNKTFSRPYWYEPYSEKYGIRRLHVQTVYLAVSDSGDAESIIHTMQGFKKDLFNWNIKNNSMFNGHVIVKGSTKYKVGTRLIYKSDEDDSEIEYYVTSVGHSYVNFGVWTTELGLTRGINPKDRFTPPWNSYEEYNGLVLGTHGSPAVHGDSPLDTAYPISGDYETKATTLIEEGKKLIGKINYVFGGKGIAFGEADCSQYTQHLYSLYAGIELGRTTGNQVTKGVKISTSDLQPGDLLFFKDTYPSSHIYGVSHVGIYIGDGQMLHNSSSGDVHITNDVLNNSYWSKHFLMARRVLQSNTKGKVMSMLATAYGSTVLNGGAGTGLTKSGTTPQEGVTVAVDTDVIPLGTRIHLESDYPGITGTYLAEDIGGAIKNNRIDIYFDDINEDPEVARKRMLKFGKRPVKVTILNK